MTRLIVVLSVALLCSAITSHAVTKRVDANIVRTLVADEGRWGGCMALTNQVLAEVGLDCPSRWVSFSCAGDFTSKEVAYRMFDSAQMALALEKSVMLLVDDTKKHNGFCYASRIDVLL